MATLRKYLGRTLHAVRRLFDRRTGPRPAHLDPPPMRALQWIRDNHLFGGGIRVQSGHSNAYPEVTGYLVPTLIEYGEADLAADLTRWLLRIQRSDGSFPDPDRGKDYVFDTGQVLRGLLAVSRLFRSHAPLTPDPSPTRGEGKRETTPAAVSPNPVSRAVSPDRVSSVPVSLDPLAIEDAIRRAADYLVGQMLDGGASGFRVQYSGKWWVETAQLYVLPPLVEAADVLAEPRYRRAAECCLEHYARHPDFLRIGDLTHFLAYELEALIDLGRADLAQPVLNRLRKVQRSSGAVRGAGRRPWVCVPGLAQLALCWYRLGQWEPADRALAWIERHQRPSGGFLGSVGLGASYKQTFEVSWAPKFYLDAHLFRVRAFFDRHAEEFPAEVSPEDGRVRAILACVRPNDCVLEVGCGKGRFLKAVRAACPGVECTGVDPSPVLSSHLPAAIRGVVGRLEAVPLPDASFDCVFSVEAMEHSANPRRAVAEMVRVCRPGGQVIVIDKQQAHWGRLECAPWEQWPDIDQLRAWLQEHCDQVSAEPVAYNEQPADGLMVVWKGKVKPEGSGFGAEGSGFRVQGSECKSSPLATRHSPAISIILPTHDGVRFLDQAVESIVAQTFGDWELVLVDDASTDQTPAKVDAWAARDARIRAVHLRANRELPGALNDGFRLASGEFWTWTSDDNWYAPTALARMIEVLRQRPEVDVVYAASTWVDEAGQPIRHARAAPAEDLAVGNCVGACFLYRRKVHEALSGYREDSYLAEDYDFWLRACGRFRLEPLDKPLFFYRRHGRSLTDLYQPAIVAATARTVEQWLQSTPNLPRQMRGRALEALGLRALVVGDVRSARRYLLRATRLLGRVPHFRGCRSYAIDLLLGPRIGKVIRALAKG